MMQFLGIFPVVKQKKSSQKLTLGGAARGLWPVTTSEAATWPPARRNGGAACSIRAASKRIVFNTAFL
jgi:hypothetical protein